MECIYCNLPIKEGEKCYQSKQPGMKGLYHWRCFVIAYTIKVVKANPPFHSIKNGDIFNYRGTKNDDSDNFRAG